MGRTYCPACGSEEVEMTDSGLTCLNCGYTGHFAEKHSLLDDEEDDHAEVEAEILKTVKPKKAAVPAKDKVKEKKTVKAKATKTSRKGKKK